VICGAAFFQYEHFDPPFVDAQEHRPEGIALLCGACHDKKTKGIWSVDKVRAARKNPVTFRAGPARDAFDITAPFILWLGSSSFQNVSTIVKTKEEESWLSIESSEENVGPVRISADFFDVQGELSLKIEGPGKVTMVDCGFLNLERGIVAHEDAKISLTRTKFRNVKIDIERERK